MLVCLISPIWISSCTTSQELARASAAQGRITAGVHLPALPADCRVKEPHAPMKVGDEARAVLKRERGQLDKANARVGRCAGFYDTTRKAFEK